MKHAEMHLFTSALAVVSLKFSFAFQSYSRICRGRSRIPSPPFFMFLLRSISSNTGHH
jgi:hypothetical protein